MASSAECVPDRSPRLAKSAADFEMAAKASRATAIPEIRAKTK